MAIAGNLRVSTSLLAYHHKHRACVRLPSSKVEFAGYANGGLSPFGINPRILISDHNVRGRSKLFSGKEDDYELMPNSIAQEVETFLLNAINMNFLDRLSLAWKIVFPSPASRKNSNARIAKQRLKMILFSDRCAVSEEAKRKIVSRVVGSLTDFVEIDSQDKVQLNVSTDSDLGTVYSVTVPVRRVKPEYQDLDEVAAITDVEYKDTADGSVDVRFDFYVPDQ